MPYLIDASNLGGLLAGRAGSRDALGVVRFVLPWARSRGQVVLVFDGERRTDVADRYGSVEVRWSAGRSADDLIRSLVARDSASWIVVTDDVELSRSCRDLGARVERASVLTGRLAQGQGLAKPGNGPGAVAGGDATDAVDKPNASASDLAHWRRVFGVETSAGRRRRGK
jgi:hypothetical protein